MRAASLLARGVAVGGEVMQWAGELGSTRAPWINKGRRRRWWYGGMVVSRRELVVLRTFSTRWT